jgi:hypothetical protein
MKENLVLGTIVGLAVSGTSWEGHKLVDPHTLSVFPSFSMGIAFLAMVTGALAVLAQRRGITHPSVLTSQAMPFLYVASAIYGAAGAVISYGRHTHPTFVTTAFAFLFMAGSLLIAGTVAGSLTARLVTPKPRATA